MKRLQFAFIASITLITTAFGQEATDSVDEITTRTKVPLGLCRHLGAND